jgi:hypothetical protein
MPENEEGAASPGSSPPSAEEHPGVGGSPVSSVPLARSRTDLTNRPTLGRMVGTPGAVARRKLAAERDMLQYRLKKARPQVEALREEQRRAEAEAEAAAESDPVVEIPEDVPVPKKRNPWAVVAIVAGVVGMIGGCVLFWPRARAATGNGTPVSAAVLNPPASPGPERSGMERSGMEKPDARAGKELGVRSVFPGRLELPADPSAALTTALAHLSTALDGAGGNPEAVLRKVSKPGQKCMMVWANDSVSLVFGGNPIPQNSLAHGLEDCAEAVSRVH